MKANSMHDNDQDFVKLGKFAFLSGKGGPCRLHCAKPDLLPLVPLRRSRARPTTAPPNVASDNRAELSKRRSLENFELISEEFPSISCEFCSASVSGEAGSGTGGVPIVINMLGTSKI
jgi:hypothetical protein